MSFQHTQRGCNTLTGGESLLPFTAKVCKKQTLQSDPSASIIVDRKNYRSWQ
jgi:hypothetical protein